MTRLRLSILFAFSVLAAALFASQGGQEQRARLQILNGGNTTIEVFWINADGELVPRGILAPGEQTILTTTLGSHFQIVDAREKRMVESEVRVQCFRYEPGSQDGVPAFYTQRASARGFPIVASARVNPFALKEAAYLVDQMLANRPDVREAMIQSGARMCVMAHDEFTTDLPEFAWLGRSPMRGFESVSGKDYWDARARGLGGSETDAFCSVAEENLLGFEGDPYEKECILIHEFAHNIHLRGLLNVDPTFDKRLKATYDAAMRAGLWKGKYAATNHHEYFAEGVQSWFDNNRVNDHDHNHVNTRALLLEYDPGLAAMCREVFGDTVLKYTKPATRLTGHLAGYDPSTAPRFVWPARLLEANAKIRGQAVARDQAANAGTRELRTVEGWTVHVSRKLLASDAAATERALALLRGQLEEIVRVVPAAAVGELRKVPLWFSPEYPDVKPKAEYHPGAQWLRDNGRDPAMAKGVEFTNVRIFEAETRRMPNFALHELAHAYHDRVLPQGFRNAEILSAFERAKAEGTYDRVERTDAEGRKSFDRHYGLTNPQEYFAESTEAYFSRNDFYPYTREELKKHDPQMAALVEKLWGDLECADSSALLSPRRGDSCEVALFPKGLVGVLHVAPVEASDSRASRVPKSSGVFFAGRGLRGRTPGPVCDIGDPPDPWATCGALQDLAPALATGPALDERTGCGSSPVAPWAHAASLRDSHRHSSLQASSLRANCR